MMHAHHVHHFFVDIASGGPSLPLVPPPPGTGGVQRISQRDLFYCPLEPCMLRQCITNEKEPL